MSARITPMVGPSPPPHDALASILQKLDDEIFFAILDVSLDIENELLRTFGCFDF